jgi:protease PrsW
MKADEILAEYERLFKAGVISQEEFERQTSRVRDQARVRRLEERGVGAILQVEPALLARILTSQVFWVVLVLAMMPLLLAAVEIPAQQGMILYFAFLWFFLFLRLFRLHLRGASPFDYSLVMALVIVPGLAAILPALRWLAAPFYRLVDTPLITARWVGFVFGVGISEELTKLLPVLMVVILARRAGRHLGLQSTLMLGIASGLAFAGFENILYSEWFGARIWGMTFTRQDVVLSRLLMTPFLHALWAALTAFAVGLVAVTGSMRLGRLLRIAGPSLALAAVLHGSYDTLAAAPVLAVLVGGASYLMVVLAILAAKRWEGGDAGFLDERVL